MHHGIEAVDFRAGPHYMPGWTMSEPSSTPPSPAAASAASDTFDPQRRRLCADGNCVGVVGADGRCRVCGLAHPEGAGDAPTFAATFAPGDDSASDVEDDDVEDSAFSVQASGGADPEGGFNPSRGLCPDGSCVGVLGADGRCKVCGRGPESAAGGTGV